ncbi:MAG: magnesium transporter [Chloroflexi bacterium]|nr:magnesium transporter [Chloroflexota bacterium]
MLEQTREFLNPSPSLADDIKSCLERGALSDAVSSLTTLHPSDQVSVLLQLDQDMRTLLYSGLTHEAAGKLLDHMDADDGADLIRRADPVLMALWLDKTGAATAAQVLRRLPIPVAKEVIEAMSQADTVVQLLEHGDDTAGGIMTPELVAFKEWTSAAEALAWLRNSHPDPKTMDRLFVVDMWNRLTGVVAISDLVVAEPGAPLRELMDPEVVYVAPGTGQDECARLMRRYDLPSLPVTDESGTLLGAILLREVMGAVESKAAKDMYRLAGLSEPERIMTPLAASVRNRLPWLLLNLVTVGMGAVVISLFESTIAKIVIAAAFIPVVASQGGVGGAQTITLMVRGLALGDIEFSDFRKALTKELALGLVNGLVLGLVVGLVVLTWKGSVVLGLALGLAMLGNMVLAGVSGVFVPLGLRLFRIDPALASMVFVSTITDVCGFLFFLGLVALLLPLLS